MLNINKIILCCVAFVSMTATSFTQEGDIIVFRKKFKSYFSTQPDSSYYFLKKILKQHTTEPDSIKSKDLNNAALYFTYQNKKDSSVIYFQRSLSIGSEKNNIGTIVNLAILYKRNSQNNKSISLFEDLLSNNYLTNKNKGEIYSQLASLYSLKNNLANFYKKNQLHDLAFPLYEKSASYNLSIKDYSSYCLTLINYSNCFLDLDDITGAQSILKRIQQKHPTKASA